ncbi:abscission/NoCut checkpoint regulator [Anopheles maculipalpis]|uniref:abscission/NoCut checkpoint regulator n=1 Tax=Anopheles maculipalpis TaxID=1496333 RepID=UPI002158B7F8|nr:abscission/NoCut checkpoint regulator [Anopheles maculipalpis]
MACTICTKSFGFFNKEHGCPVCKFSFCSGCLKYKLVRDGKKLNVCLRCSKLAAEPPKANAKHMPATTHKDGAETSPKQSKPRIPSPIETQEDSTGDDLLRNKLEALKANDSEENQCEPGVDHPSTGAGNVDIEKRLAALKGIEYKDYKDASKRFMAPDNRTAEQKVQDLLGQFVEETKLINVMDDMRAEQDDEIVKRLNALKQFPSTGAEGSSRPATLPDSDSDEDLTDEELARKLAKRYAEEGKMEAKLRLDSELDEEPSTSISANGGDLGEELPWCTICNEDAVLRCRGCDNDLYCRGCYKEFHYDEDPNEHQTVPFKGGKGVRNA